MPVKAQEEVAVAVLRTKTEQPAFDIDVRRIAVHDIRQRRLARRGESPQRSGDVEPVGIYPGDPPAARELQGFVQRVGMPRSGSENPRS